MVKYDAWKETWPSKEDFQSSMPICWNKQTLKAIHEIALPSALRTESANSVGQSQSKSYHLLHRQEQKLEKDWKVFSQGVLGADFSTFRYCWLVVNTRSFYYELPGMRKPSSVDDRIALCPFIDYFNHQDEGVSGYLAS